LIIKLFLLIVLGLKDKEGRKIKGSGLINFLKKKLISPDPFIFWLPFA